MDGVPREVVETILSKLPVKYLIRCRCVCKSWFNLTHDPNFIQLHLLRSSQQNPSLIFKSTICIDPIFYFRSQLFLCEDQSSCSLIGANLTHYGFHEFRVLGSCNGLLCLINSRDEIIEATHCFSVLVCNPCTGVCTMVPNLISPLEKEHGNLSLLHYLAFGFGFCVKSNGYKILKIVFSPRTLLGPGQSKAFVYSLSDMNWREVGAPPFKVPRDYRPEYLNGALHWRRDSTIVTFNFADELFGVLPCPARPSQSPFVLNGCLSVGEFQPNNCISIWVLKDYGVAASWTKSLTIDLAGAPWHSRSVRVICVQKDGEILMVFMNQVLASYNLETRSFKRLGIVGLPSWFRATCFVGSLVSPPTLQSTQRRGR